MIKRCILIVSICVVLLSSQSPLYAIDIYATGGWTDLVINSSHLRGGAGSDLVDSFESNANATMISITGTSDASDVWEVQIRKSTSSWPSDAILSVERTGDGGGGGSIDEGTSYIAVGESDVTFFRGSGDRTNVPVRYKISGLSIMVPPGTYSALITFTVVDR